MSARRDLLRPVELVGGAAITSAFTGLVVFAATRVWATAAIAFGVAFIVVLVGLAMFQLAARPDDAQTPGGIEGRGANVRDADASTARKAEGTTTPDGTTESG